MEEVQVLLDLKYCERCGGLWLRPRRLRQVYCRQCEMKMRETAFAGYRKQGHRSDLETVAPVVLQAAAAAMTVPGGAF